MKTPITSRRFVFAAAIFISACGATADARVATTPPAGRPAIAKGMSGATIRQLIGDPFEIRKIETDGASGESWIYRRDMGTEVTQEAVLVEQVPAFVGPGYGNSDNIDLINVPSYRLKRTKLTQITALLMVEDTLVFARQWVERDTSYEN
jgi:hypothetical protein